MKKVLLFGLLGISFLVNSCKKEETPEITTVSTEHKSLLLDFTATWCCPCGNAVPIFDEVVSRYPYKVVPMALHASNDSFYNATMYWHWANIYDVQGIPSFVGDNERISWGYVLPDLHLDTSHFYEVINATVYDTPPAVGIGLKKEITGNTMTIKSKTVFFRETTGRLSLAIYIVEDGIYFDQNCSDDDIHDHVFRASLTDPQGKGLVLIDGTAAKGKAFDNTFTFEIPSDYVKANLHVIGVVYQLDPSSANAKPIAVLNVNNI